MTKYFCDRCEKELTANNSCPVDYQEVGAPVDYKNPDTIKQIASTFLHQNQKFSTNERGKSQIICKYCVIDIIKTLDDRPVVSIHN